MSIIWTRAVEVPKKKAGKKAPATGACRRLLRRLYIVYTVYTMLHKGFRVTGLALVIILRCDWPLCDLRFKSYQHLKLKIFISMHTAGTWWIFQPKSSEKSTENACVNSSPPALSQTLCTVQKRYWQFSYWGANLQLRSGDGGVCLWTSANQDCLVSLNRQTILSG